jgi:organic radical activating enzyme
MKEITFELTNYCPHDCKFCSSKTTKYENAAEYLSLDQIEEIIDDSRATEYEKLDRIILSGGEPLAHPDFYKILMLCKAYADDVVVYTNALTHIAYNANAIDGIYIEAAISVPDSVNKVRVLKRIKQGREKTRPEVTFSKNFDHKCHNCEHTVVEADGKIGKPCKK